MKKNFVLAVAAMLLATGQVSAKEPETPYGVDYHVAFYSCKDKSKRPCGVDEYPQLKYKVFQDDASAAEAFANMEAQLGTLLWKQKNVRKTPREEGRFYK